MRFDSGILLHSGVIDNYPPIDEWVTTVRLLEELEFTGVWAAEHHFFWDGWTNPAPTNPLMFGALAAAHTEKLRIGQCGVSLPDWHPIRAAEDAAMLDHMSKGRLEFGALRGVNNRVNGNFRAEADRRDPATNKELFWESLDIVEAAWRDEPFRHEGKFYTLPFPGWRDERTPKDELDRRYYSSDGELTHLSVVPKPYQQPMPPRWVMADSVSSTREGASRGLGVMSYAQSFEATRATFEAYRSAPRRDAEAEAQPERLAVMRPIYVAETQAEAEAVMRPAINNMMAKGVRANLKDGRRMFLAADEEMDESSAEDEWFDFLVRHGHVHVGTPSYVVERLKRFEEELGANHIVLFWAVPSVSFGAFQAGLKLFAEKVMPEF